MDFENIYIEKLNFENEKLNGKDYTITVDEYTNGNLTNSSAMFETVESKYFKVNGNKETLKFFFKMENGKLTAYIRGKVFSNRKSFPLVGDASKYVLKDFFGNKAELNLDITKKNPIFSIITPTIHKDGSGSYCEVAQSGIAVEKIGTQFNIPHYFIVNILFK